MARRSWTIIPNDWIQLERVINQLGYNILDVPSSLSDIISDISTAKSDLTVKINSDEILLSDATVIASNAAVAGISDAAVVQSHLTYRANSIENLASDAIAKCISDEAILSDQSYKYYSDLILKCDSDEKVLSDAIAAGASLSEVNAVSDRLVSVSDELDTLSDSVLSIETYLSDNTATVKSDLILKIESDEIILSDRTTLISNKLFSDIIAEASNRATGDSDLRLALNSDEVVLSDNIVLVSNAVGAGGGATQSEMDAVSDRLVSVSNELDALSDSVLSIETYLSNDTATVKSDLILKIESDETILSDRIFSVDAMSKSNDAVCASHWRAALNSDETYLSDAIVTVSNAGGGGGATQSEMDAVSDRLVSVSNELDAVSDSVLSVETYLSDNTTTLSNALISPTFVDMQITEHAYFDAEVDNGNSGAADTINWTIGNKQKSTITANCIYTFTSPTGPCNLIFKIVQDGTGGWTVTWPATVKWPLNTAPTLSTAASAVDIIAFYYDGTDYYGAISGTMGSGGTSQQRDYLLYRDVKAAGTDGGTFTSGAWQTRTLTEETIDTGGNGSLAANEITLATGSYECNISAPGYSVNHHQLRLYNVTDAVVIVYGVSSDTVSSTQTTATLVYKFSITASKIIRIEHRCSSTKSSTGFGLANNFGGDEVYTSAQFWKVN